jgi:beta-glucosidase
MDVIHGYETFPIPLGLSCTWDMKLIERSAQIAAQESADGINWTFPQWLIFLGSHAGAGFLKVPAKIRFLGSQIAKAMVEGYQGMIYQKTTPSCRV